ncbi:hypothetical protein [Halorubrum salsamenti]|uniref:hypothetical protein n=1 Tax=Halorubrum salsamenti TaxID=2583990 RepID=UPI0011A5DF72|nr:hypothetical protein [Halorubrum salsamenti]
MTTTPPDELGSLITPELISYLGAGTMNPQRLATSVDYAGLNIENLNQLKQLHFVLYSDVVQYVERLEERLRRVKTEQQQHDEVTHGEVRGPIQWQQTFQQRPQTGDKTLFVISNPAIELDIPENRVVKKLLATIAAPLREDIENADRSWRSMWDDADIVDFQRTLESNVYLNQLPPADTIEITDQDLATTRRSRHRLYSKAAELYRLYEDLLNDRYDEPDVQKLFRETIVTPTKDYVLFELFCVLSEIRRLQRDHDELALQRIEPGMDELALMENDRRRVAVYYDQGGPLDFFTAHFDAAELRRDWDVPTPMIRRAEALERHESLVESFLESGKQHSYYSGRPDLLVVEYEKTDDSERLDRVRLGEAKYTRSQSTFATGLRELLEYVHFAQEAGQDGYVFDDQLDTADMDAILFTDGVKTTLDAVDGVEHRRAAAVRDLFE